MAVQLKVWEVKSGPRNVALENHTHENSLLIHPYRRAFHGGQTVLASIFYLNFPVSKLSIFVDRLYA
jgi:hypothetical protein